MTLKLFGMCGSLRAGSFNRKTMLEAAAMFGGDFEEGSLRLPLYDGDLESAEGIPQEVQALADGIAAADAVVIASPEYNQSLSGVTKNALDWISRTDGNPWKGKPVALVHAAAGRAGGARGNYALRLAMAPFQPEIVPGPEVLIAGASNQFDDNGRLTPDSYRDALAASMAALRAKAQAAKG